MRKTELNIICLLVLMVVIPAQTRLDLYLRLMKIWKRHEIPRIGNIIIGSMMRRNSWDNRKYPSFCSVPRSVGCVLSMCDCSRADELWNVREQEISEQDENILIENITENWKKETLNIVLRILYPDSEITIENKHPTRRNGNVYPGFCTLPGTNQCQSWMCDCKHIDSLWHQYHMEFMEYRENEIAEERSKLKSKVKQVKDRYQDSIAQLGKAPSTRAKTFKVLSNAVRHDEGNVSQSYGSLAPFIRKKPLMDDLQSTEWLTRRFFVNGY